MTVPSHEHPCDQPPAAVSPEVRVESGGRVTVVLRGRLDILTTGGCWRELQARLRPLSVTQLEVEASGLDFCSNIGMALLRYLSLGGMTPGATVTMHGLDEQAQKVLHIFTAEDYAACRSSPPPRSRVPAEVGLAAITALQELREHVIYLGSLTAAWLSALVHPKRMRWPVVKQVFETAGVNALPIISILGVLVGSVIALESVRPLAEFGAQIYIANMIGLVMVRDMGPFIMAIIFAGRSGSAFAAELGTMKVTEELDALVTMGLDPVRFLVVQRLTAAVLLTPLLAVYAMFMGIVGGVIVMWSLGYPVLMVYHQMATSVTPSDISHGLAKSLVFGIIVAGIGCLRGLQTQQGPSAVGASTTRAVVASILLIVVADAIFATLAFLQK